MVESEAKSVFVESEQPDRAISDQMSINSAEMGDEMDE